MTPLETYLSAHLRYHVWATRRALGAVSELTGEAYARDLGAGQGSVRGLLERILAEEWNAYELLAGERAGLEEPEGDYYAEFGHLATDFEVILARYEQLAGFLTDLELALYFARSTAWVPWLEATLPKWQLALSAVGRGAHRRGQLAGLLRQLGHGLPADDLAEFYLSQTARQEDV